ncbi:hypothetical protein NECAME_18042, partial [Necator americanus]
AEVVTTTEEPTTTAEVVTTTEEPTTAAEEVTTTEEPTLEPVETSTVEPTTTTAEGTTTSESYSERVMYYSMYLGDQKQMSVARFLRLSPNDNDGDCSLDK